MGETKPVLVMVINDRFKVMKQRIPQKSQKSRSFTKSNIHILKIKLKEIKKHEITGFNNFKPNKLLGAYSTLVTQAGFQINSLEPVSDWLIFKKRLRGPPKKHQFENPSQLPELKKNSIEMIRWLDIEYSKWNLWLRIEFIQKLI